MDDTGDSKNKLVQIFENMEYGNDYENINEAVEWLKIKENKIFAYIDKKDESLNGEIVSIKNVNNEEDLCHIYVPLQATVDSILTKCGETNNVWHEIPASKKAEILFQLGAEIRKKQNLFIQLEIAARSILSEDTKNDALPLLTDYFQYYSSYCVKQNLKNLSRKPEGLAVCILQNESPLWTLGCVLGPCLALGYKIILQTGSQLSLIATLLSDIANDVGIPEGTIRVIPGDVDPNIFFTHSKVSIISVFDDLFKEKYQISNHFNKKVIHFSSSGTPMIIFDDCDLDSASHNLINAVWGNTGMLPWSTRRIFIQENIFKNFVQKLKNNINQLSVGSADKKNIDISFPSKETVNKVAAIVERVKNEGFEVYQTDKGVIPALVIGGNIFPNNVIKEDYIDVPVVTLTAFRTINEAVALSNNTRQGLGVSVWTENTSLVHEIIDKLQFTNIWINSHGMFSVDVAFSPYKSSGNAYFGGKEGISEYLPLVETTTTETSSQVKSGELMEKAINEAKKAQVGWFKLNRFERNKIFQGMCGHINANRKNWNLEEKWLDDWTNCIYDYITTSSGENFTKKKNFNVVTSRIPCRVIAVEILQDKQNHNKKVLISALVEGNCVIVLNNSKETNEFYRSIAKFLPLGVLTVLPHSHDAIKTAALHKELNVFIGEKYNKIFSSILPLLTSSKFKLASRDNWNEIRNYVTLVKNVWFNRGQSFV